jgi:hypothetical protein
LAQSRNVLRDKKPIRGCHSAFCIYPKGSQAALLLGDVAPKRTFGPDGATQLHRRSIPNCHSLPPTEASQQACSLPSTFTSPMSK